VGLWTVHEMMGPDIKWSRREDLVAEVAEVKKTGVCVCVLTRGGQMGDTVYVKPLVHVLAHNAEPLRRVKDFLGLPSDKVTVVHYDAEMSVGRYALSQGGRVRNNPALDMAANALKEENFGRLAIGVASAVAAEGQVERMFTFGLRGLSMEKLHEFWLANRLPEAALETLRTRVVGRLVRELSGSARQGSIFDTVKRM
jgi:peptidyl-tRNA hydrolase